MSCREYAGAYLYIYCERSLKLNNNRVASFRVWRGGAVAAAAWSRSALGMPIGNAHAGVSVRSSEIRLNPHARQRLSPASGLLGYCFPCCPWSPGSSGAPTEACGSKLEGHSLLAKYGVDELSDTDGDDDAVPENPMSPEQIAAMLDRHIALTRELELDIVAEREMDASCGARTSSDSTRSAPL